MSDIAIQIDGLGKQFRIGTRDKYPTFRAAITNAVLSPIRQLRRGSAGNTAGTFWALRDVGFNVQRGDVVGIIGRNGAGKSTLLKVLSRITAPTEGSVCIAGRVGSLLEVGTGFHPELTGRENIYLNGAILGMKRGEIARKFDEIVAFSEIEKFLDTPVKHYSSGMYMRLAFAVAAHLEPEILVVDEVLAVGDAEFQKKCLGKMKDVGKSGRTVLFVSHNMNAIEQLCSGIVHLDRGKVVAQSRDVRKVISDYLFGKHSSVSAWTNAGHEFENRYFTPSRFFLADGNGQPIPSQQPNNAEIWIHLEGELGDLDPALTLGYAIFSEDGQCLYWSYNSDERPEDWPILRKGKLALRSQLPPRFLNEGSYRLELIGGLHHRQWLFTPGVNAPSITLTIQGGLSDSPLWMNRRPTLLAPVLKWELCDGPTSPN
jgi:lipopolysaccharide transport system ATP-binding protein